jgi:YHS domain-containing protein
MTVVVDPDALALQRGGDTHYFCGDGCRRAFERLHPA